jgi:hypothetical protein
MDCRPVWEKDFEYVWGSGEEDGILNYVHFTMSRIWLNILKLTDLIGQSR